MAIMSFFEELKRRNVYRVAIAYTAVGWLVVEVTDTVAPAFNLPDWTLPLVTWIGIIGFPFALVFAWAFELTPEGLKRESEVDPGQSITHLTGRRLDFAIIGLLVVAVAYFAYDKFEPGTVETARVSADAELAPGPKQAVPPSRQTRSIAEIARALDVEHVLEGFVRKAGDQVRITAQLIRADNSSHLWSARYDRTLDNIFAVQEEIAAEVAKQLKVTLLGAEAGIATTAPEAYSLYLQARFNRNLGTPERWEQATALYEQALAIDPGYAAAWAELASTRSVQLTLGLLPADRAGSLREFGERALAIDPSSIPAHNALARSAMFTGDFTDAARHLKQSLALGPTTPDTLVLAANLLQILGRSEDSIAVLEYVVSIDPLNPESHSQLRVNYWVAEQPEEASRSPRKALQLSPGHLFAKMALSAVLRVQGEFEQSLEMLQALPAGPLRQLAMVHLYAATERIADAYTTLDSLVEKYGDIPQLQTYIATAWGALGEYDRVYDWLTRAGCLSESASACPPSNWRRSISTSPYPSER